MSGDAIISPCGLYRYRLTRQWGDGPTAVFVMLNPSTADASQDDPTIRRCIGFAKREGCGSLLVVNLFAYRATDPDGMFRLGVEPVGDENDGHIADAMLGSAGPVIAAWGGDKRAKVRVRDVRYMAGKIGVRLLCLGKTKDGSPRHPLYVKGVAPLVPL